LIVRGPIQNGIALLAQQIEKDEIDLAYTRTLFYISSRRFWMKCTLWFAFVLFCGFAHPQEARLHVQRTHQEVNAVAFSPNGRLALIGCWDSAQLWDVRTGMEIQRFDGETTSVSFSPDGRRALTGTNISASYDHARLWDLATGKEILRLKTSHSGAASVAISPDGHLGLTGSDPDNRVYLWDLATGKELMELKGELDFGRVQAIAFSPNGKLALTSDWKIVHLWDLNTGREILRLKGHTDDVNSVAFSPDGHRAITGSMDNTTRVWDLSTGNETLQLKGHLKAVSSVAISPDGSWALTGSWDNTARVWNLTTGQQLQEVEVVPVPPISQVDGIASVAISPDGKWALTGGLDRTARLWDVSNWKEVRNLVGRSDPVLSIATSVNDREILFVAGDERTHNRTVHQWDELTGKERQVAEFDEWHQGGEYLKFISVGLVNGRIAVAEQSNDTFGVYWIDPVTGAEIVHVRAEFSTPSVAASADGQWAITEDSRYLKIWDLMTGEDHKRFRRSDSEIGLSTSPVAISADARWLLVKDYKDQDHLLHVLDARTGEDVAHFKPDLDPLIPREPYALSPDGRWVMAGSRFLDHSATIWEVGSGKEIHLEGQTDSVGAVAFSGDGFYAMTGSKDGAIRLLETNSGNPIATLVSFRGGDWAVEAPDDRFDAGSLEKIEGMQWIMSDAPWTPLSPEIFMRDYYEPRLLPRLLACHAAEATDPKACETAFPKVRPLGELNRVQPEVRILGVRRGASADEAVVEVEALGKTDATEPNHKTHTEAYDLRLFRDGQLVGQWPEPKGATNGPEEIEAWQKASQVPTARHGFQVKLPSEDLSKPVVFTAYAFNEDRVKSETAQADPYKLPADIVKRRPRAYVITVGVDHYKTPRWELEYAAKDAEDMSSALRQIQGYEVVPVTLASETSATGVVDQATKENIHAVLRVLATGRPEKLAGVARADELAQATPDDVVILSFSGHGHTEKNGAFYLLPSDADPDVEIPPTSLPSFISSEELSEWLRNVDAGQMAMIIDACHSAASVDVPGFKPGPMGDRGLGQLAYDKGMRILAASQADDIALEIESLHQGLLTYALREGLMAGKDGKLPAASEGEVTLQSWLKVSARASPFFRRRLDCVELNSWLIRVQ
jgi:WD40 repeat protein